MARKRTHFSTTDPITIPSSDDDDLSYYTRAPTSPPPTVKHDYPSARASPPPAVRTIKHDSGTGDRILMTDDESDDDAPPPPRKRPRQPHLSSKKRPQNPIVGLRPPPRPARHIPTTTPSASNPALPAHLHRKRQKLQCALDAGDTSLLHLAPSYTAPSDPGDLQRRPSFPGAAAGEPRDIPLPDSGGVIPAAIAQWLRGYQVSGAAFLHRNYVFQTGCVLGDEMGLGKTVQVIAFLTAAFGKTGDERDAKRMRAVRREGRWYPKVLVVCPGTLMENWRAEFETWGWWVVEVFHGAAKDRVLRSVKGGSCEVVITNYETYRACAGDVNEVFWDAVVADECHRIKERGSEITQRMNEVNALCRIGLTGTAIQNKYDELWTLLNWCRPGQVGTFSAWKTKIAKPLMIGQSHSATLQEIGTARKVATKLVANLLPRLFLRRTKDLIEHQLPKKSDRVVFCPLSPLQREAYDRFLETEAVRIIRDGNEPCECGAAETRRKCCFPTDARGRTANELIFPAIIWLQKLSNHLVNWLPTSSDSSDTKAEKLSLLQECLPAHYETLTTRAPLLNYMDPSLCGKWAVLQHLLSFWHASNDKVLIFSHSLTVLSILRSLFTKTSYNTCYLDGSMSLPDRTQQIHAFNTDPTKFAFLISTRAGGTGLTLTAANKVVIFDAHWNPSHDLQAQDRAHRIGQTRPVHIFRLIAASTIEETVYARQIYKQQQARIAYTAAAERRYFRAVMDDPDNRGELFGLRNLFSGADAGLVRAVVHATNIAERRAGVEVAEVVAVEAGRRTVVGADPVAAILAEAGVVDWHDNAQVLGESRAERGISRWAVEGVEQMGVVAGYRFNPPREVCVRQMVSMARALGFEGRVREFALVVEEWSPEERRDALERFYAMRRERREKREKGSGGDAVAGEESKEEGETERKEEERKEEERKELVMDRGLDLEDDDDEL